MRKNETGRKPVGDEKQLPPSEAKYRALFDSIDEGFVVAELLFDEQGKPFDLLVVETNASFDRMMRTTNAVGKRALEIFPNAESSWFEAYGRVVETGQTLRFENYLAALDRWFDLYVSRMGNADNRRFVIVFNDITERKKAEQELKRTKELLQATLDSSLEDIQLFKAIRDENGAIIDFTWVFTNKTWNDKWGDMSGKRLLDQNPGVVETGLFDKFVSVTESGIPIVHEQFYAHEQFNGWFLQSIVKMEDGFLLTAVEITEHKLAAEAFRKSEEKYRTLFNSIDEGFCIVEVLFDEHQMPLDYRFLEINASFEQQTGIVHGVGRGMREIEPRHEEYWFEIYGKVALTGEATRFEHYAEHLGHRWYEVYAFRLGEPHEHKVGILFHDISERKRAEWRQAFLLTLSDALRPLHEPANIKATATRLLGRRLAADRVLYAEYVQKSGEDYFLIERVNHVPENIFPNGLAPVKSFGRDGYEVLKGKSIVINDVAGDTGIAPNAQETFKALHVRAYVALPLMKEGNFVALLAVSHVNPHEWKPEELDLIQETAELTWVAVERAKAEEELRRSEERLRLIIESAQGYAIFTTDNGGFINSWSTGAAHIFGWSEAEILGQNSAVLFTPEDRAAGEHKKELETARTQGIAPDIRWHQRKDGSRVFIHGEVRPLPDGEHSAFAKIGRDLTAQRQAEEALRENQKQLQLLNETLEQQVEEKTSEVREVASELVKATQQERHRISHLLHDDLQQSIYATQMHMTFLSSLLKDGQEAARKEALSIADQLNEILEMTRQLSIELSPPILRGEGLWHAIHWLAGRMQQRYEISIELQADGPFVIPAEELHVLLFNCVRELLFNVIKHAKATRAVVVLEWTKDQNLRIEVHDNGKGFNVDAVEESTGKHNDMPQSLGLPTIRHQLGLFGGTMEIHSTPGAGTQVVIIVPVPKASQ